MLKRYFIPLMVLLVLLAVGIYFVSGSAVRERDVRTAVPVEKFRLTNGLEVVVMPNDRMPVVSHLLVVKAGAADDPYGKSGLAHYLEHLMFGGTKNFPEGAYDRAIARVGGEQNAYTTRDYTLYYATVPKQHMPAVMTMEADRLANLIIDPTIAARELKVITEERGIRVENNPAAQWHEQLDALTFLNHPYGRPVIGWAEDMASFTPEDAAAFHAMYYRPSNMILVVAGDVTVAQVRRDAQRYYGGLTASAAPVRAWPKEPPMRLTRRGEMRDVRVNEPRLLRQYVAPSVKEGTSAQAMALAVFAQYLGGGDASVLYDALVRQQNVATQVSVSYDPQSIGPALFRIRAIPAAGVSLGQLEEALNRALEQAMTAPLDAAGIDRAKTLLKADAVFAQDGLQPLAQWMAQLYAIGLDEQYFYQWTDSIEQVSAASALEAARAVLVAPRGVTGQLLPQVPTPPTVTEATHAP
jgi:zinc protease